MYSPKHQLKKKLRNRPLFALKKYFKAPCFDPLGQWPLFVAGFAGSAGTPLIVESSVVLTVTDTSVHIQSRSRSRQSKTYSADGVQL